MDKKLNDTVNSYLEKNKNLSAEAVKTLKDFLAVQNKPVHKYTRKPDLKDIRDYMYEPVKTVSLPLSVDLRPLQSPVEDQGDLGDCVEFGTGGNLEFIQLQGKLPLVAPSHLFAYYNARVLEGTVSSDSGSTISDGLKTLKNTGTCPETMWPYNTAAFMQKPSTACYTSALQHKIEAYYRINNIDLSDTRNLLAQNQVFIFGITVYSSFESDEANTTGVIPMPSKNDTILGGHCLLCVGYNDKTEQFIFKNSWGTGWGASGYGFLPYAYMTNVNLTSDVWYIKTAHSL